MTDPSKLQNFRSNSFGTGPSWEDVSGVDWYPVGDREVANLVGIAPVESLTQEHINDFRVVLPWFDNCYQGFSGLEIPPLLWIQRSFPNHGAVVHYWRHRN